MLNEKQKKFAGEYLVDYNATQAAIRAGYSKKTAKQIGQRLLTFVDVQNYLVKKKKTLAEKLEISQERTLKEIARLAYSDIRCLFNEDGGMKSISELTNEQAAIVSSIESEEIFDGRGEDRQQVGISRKIKIWSKPQALEMLAKHFKIFEEQLPPAATFNLSVLGKEDLKKLLHLKQKLGK